MVDFNKAVEKLTKIKALLEQYSNEDKARCFEAAKTFVTECLQNPRCEYASASIFYHLDDREIPYILVTFQLKNIKELEKKFYIEKSSEIT